MEICVEQSKDEYNQFVDQPNGFQVIFLVDETHLDINWQSFEDDIGDLTDFLPEDAPNYSISIIKTSAEEPRWLKVMTPFVENYLFSESKNGFLDNLEESLCKADSFPSPDANLVKGAKCNDLVDLHFYIDAGVDLAERIYLEEGMMQIIESITFSKINLRYIGGDSKDFSYNDLESSEEVLEKINLARKKIRNSALFKDRAAAVTSFSSTVSIARMSSDPDSTVKPVHYLLTNQEGFQKLSSVELRSNTVPAKRTLGDSSDDVFTIIIEMTEKRSSVLNQQNDTRQVIELFLKINFNLLSVENQFVENKFDLLGQNSEK